MFYFFGIKLFKFFLYVLYEDLNLSFVFDFVRVVSGGNWGVVGELCVDGGGKKKGRERKMVEDGVEGYLWR